VALLQARYRKAYELEDQHKLARGLDDQWTVIERRLAPKGGLEREQARPKPGYGALQLRLLYSRAAVWLNVQLLEEHNGHDGQAAWDRAHAAVRWLVRRLQQVEVGKDEEDPKLDELASDLCPAARYIWEGMINRRQPDWPSTQDDAREVVEICQLVKAWGTAGLNRTAHYDRACSLASMRGAEQQPGVLREALDELEQAVTDDDLRNAARRDPSFLVFRRLDPDDKLRERYKQLVGHAPSSDFLALAPFTLHAEKLRACGITTAADLAQASTQGLAEHLGVERYTVRRWQEIARLAEHPPGGGPLNLGILQLLVRLEIRSLAELRAQLKNPDGLHEQLVQEAVNLKLVPTRKETINRWIAWRRYWARLTGLWAAARRRSQVEDGSTTAERD
jgi:hypothetical protein